MGYVRMKDHFDRVEEDYYSSPVPHDDHLHLVIYLRFRSTVSAESTSVSLNRGFRKNSVTFDMRK